MKTRRNWFRRLLFSYLPILFVVSAVLIAVSFFFIVQLSQRAAGSANDFFAQTISTSIDQMLRPVDRKIMQDIQTDETMMRFFQGEPDTYLSNYQIAQKLWGYSDEYPIIDSIYMVRWSDGFIISQQGLANLDTFPEREFIKEQNRKPVPLYWTPNRNIASKDSSKLTTSVISLPRKVPLQTGDQGIMIVNIKTEYVTRLVKDSMAQKYGFIKIIGRHGEEILSTDQAVKVSDKSMLARATSAYTGWTIISGVKDGSILAFTSLISNLWIGLGSLITVLGVLWVIYNTRRNYRPIETIFSQLKSYSYHKRHPILDHVKVDEFSFIESTFEELVGQLGKFEKNSERDRIIRVKHLFHEVVTGGFVGELKDLKSDMQELGLITNDTDVRFLLCVAEIDDFHSFVNRFSVSDQYLLKYVLTKTIEEVAENQQLNTWVEWTSNSQLALMIIFDGLDNGKQPLDHINRFWKEVLDWIERNLDFAVTVGVGTPVIKLDDFPVSYQNAEDVLRYKWILENQRIIWNHDILMRSDQGIYDYQSLVGELAYSFRIGDDEWEALFEQLFHKVKAAVLAKEEMMSLLKYLVFVLDRELSSLNFGSMDSFKEDSLSYVHEEMFRFKSVTDIQYRLKKMLSELSGHIQRFRESQSNHQTIHDVKVYIAGQYHDPGLSLTSVSEKFEMSGNYLSRLFKEEYGENFVNYLIKLRINQAKQLLAETTLPVQQIANMVGYTHSVSFNRAFKKLVGKTPGEFRN